MAAQDYYGVVQQLYVSYFGRPADYFGLQNFANQLQAMNAPTTFAGVQAAVGADAAGTSALSRLVNTFNSSAESVALYGNDNSQLGVSKFVNAIYMNVLGREADIEGFNFWTNAIASGSLSKANAAAAITQGAMTNTSTQGLQDKLTVENKLAVATSFTAALDTPTEFNAYAGDAAAATGRSLLQGVNNTTSLTDYQANINDAVNTIVNVAVPGNTVSLTVGVDTIVGTSGDDVFNAIPQNPAGEGAETLGSFDTIDGGAGRDTLNIYATAGGNTIQQGTVKNVETINIYNQTAANKFAAAGIDASKFIGATNINQVGNVSSVNNLSASTTATFTNASTATTALNVAAADSATSVKVALSNVTGVTAAVVGSPAVDPVDPVLDEDGEVVTPGNPGSPAVGAVAVNQATLNVSGAALSSVTVSGTVAQANTASSTGASLLLNVAAGATSTGASVGTVSVNTAVKTTLTVTEGDDTDSGNVTTVNAAASTGGITYVAANTVSNISTGTGADTVTIRFATAAASGDVAAKNASVSTGAGKDNITVLTTGTGLTTVDAGAGDDTITVTKVAGAGLNIQGGEGNDTVVLQGAALATTDVIDGGAGTDVISVAGSSTRRADDFIVFNKLIKNFETIKFSSAEGAAATALDASLLGTNYTTIDLATGSFITKVGAQNIVANGALTASAVGYTPADGETKAVYGGTLNITQKATGTVTANADVVKLTVAAGASGDVTGTLAGDAKSAIVTLNNSLNSAGDTDTIAKFALTTAAGTDAALTSLTLSGTGTATVINANGTALVNVDASALAGKFTVGENAGKSVGGLTYTSSNSAVETIKLGAGVDKITLDAGASTYGKVDTITGLNLVLDAAGTGLAATSDTLKIAGATGAVKFTTTQTDFDLALKDAAAYTVNGVAQETVVFALGGDTYVYHDGGVAGSVDAADVVVKLTGTVNLDALVLALGTAN